MPTGQQYATNVPQTTLTGSVNASATSLSVASSASWPSVPFTAVLDIGTSTQEPVDVTAVVGTTWTVTRNIDGTTGFAHAIGATVTHADIGRDFREARTHMDASTNVHGLSGGAAVVGDTQTQTLTNKTLTAPVIATISNSGTLTLPTGPETLVGRATTDTLTNKTLTSPSIGGTVAGGATYTTPTFTAPTSDTYTFTGITGTAGGNRLAGRTTAGFPTSGTFALNDIVYDSNGGAWRCSGAGTPGTWVPMTDRYLFQSSSLTGLTSQLVSIPSYGSVFTTLRLEYVSRTNTVGGGSLENLLLRINGVTTASYQWQNVTLLNGGAVTANTSAGAANFMVCGITYNSVTANSAPGVGFIDIPFFNDTTFEKRMYCQSSAGDAATADATMTGSGGNTSTSAVTSVTLLTNGGVAWLAGSKLKAYLLN